MSIHDSELMQRMARLLYRKEPRARIKDNPQAQKDETSALVAALRRNCPAHGDTLPEWWERFEAAVGETCGDFWPSEKNVLAACKTASQAMPKMRDTTGGWVLDPHKVASDKMKNGQPVGENWLWGQDACHIIAKRLVDEETMRKYRSAAYFARKDIYGEEAAKAWEAQMMAKHDDARTWFRDTDKAKRPVSVPDKRAPINSAHYGVTE